MSELALPNALIQRVMRRVRKPWTRHVAREELGRQAAFEQGKLRLTGDGMSRHDRDLLLVPNIGCHSTLVQSRAAVKSADGRPLAPRAVYPHFPSGSPKQYRYPAVRT